MKKLFLITGANRGLGKALVDIALKDEEVIIVSLSRSLHEDHKQIEKSKLIFIETDLSRPFSDTFFNAFNIHIKSETTLYFFNNASIILPISKIGSFKDENVETILKVNIQYPVNLINSFLMNYQENKLVFINISSGAGNHPISFWSLYCASKAFMIMFFNVLKEENLNSERIKFYSIDPGVLDTGMQENIRDNQFPNQEYFKSLKDENKLIEPSTAALKIFAEIKINS